jgi:phosphate transport system substrate-binding protein
MSRNWTMHRRTAVCVASLSAAVAVAGCGSDNGTTSDAANADTAGCVSGTLAGGGSTFQLNVEQQWAADFGQQCTDAKVNYSGVGSGAGIQQFGAGTIDFAGSDVAMVDTEQQAADKRCNGKAITFPVTAGGVGIIYNVEGVDDLNLSADTLAGIFQGTIKRWNDPAIKAENPGAALPDTPVVTYHRADGSGTTAVFSAFEDAAAPDAWKLGSDKELDWPSGQGATGSDGVVQGVKSTDGGITYAEVSYATANNLPTASVKGADGKYVALTSDTVSEAIDTGFTPSGTGPDVVGPIDVTKLTGYPLSTVSYAIVCRHYDDAATAELVKGFLGYALDQGQGGVTDLGYAPLPSGVASDAKNALESVS